MKTTQLKPDLQYVLNQYTDFIKRNFNCIQVGKIVEFYPDDKTADVEIMFKQRTFGNPIDYPLLLKCPVLGNRITTPVEKDEFVVVMFNDVNIDSFWETGEKSIPYTADRHNISDGIILCGLNALSNAIEEYDLENIHLRQNTRISGELKVEQNASFDADVAVSGNVDVSGDITANKLTADVVANNGASGSFKDSGQGASMMTLTIENGIITNIG